MFNIIYYIISLNVLAFGDLLSSTKFILKIDIIISCNVKFACNLQLPYIIAS